MSAKAALKAAKAALDKQDYDKAIEHAQEVLSTDSSNYFARLFLARAHEKKGQFDESIKTYQAATKSKPSDPQAWLGLCSVYEAQEDKRLDDYREAVQQLAALFGAEGNRDRCQTTFEKLLAFTKKYGTPRQIRDALRLSLPSNPLYEFLEGRVPHPYYTYVRIAESIETEESQKIKEEINNRRTRIGARIGQVTLEVKREVFATSELEDLYQKIIDWAIDDDSRRQYEEKLLERAHETLLVLPLEQKAAKLDQVLTMAEGMVIIHHPFFPAWELVLESRDAEDLGTLDAGILREFVDFFPQTGTAKVLKAWLSSELSPFPQPKRDEQDEDAEAPLTPEDRLLLITDGIADARNSSFAQRLTGNFYLSLHEYQSTIDTARSGISALETQSKDLGLSLQNTRDAINSDLATALVHHQAPRHHAEARKIFEDILQRKSKYTSALIGLGLIFEETGDFADAIKFLTDALEHDKGNIRVGTELAWCKAQNGDYTQASAELEKYLEMIKAEDPRTKDLRAQTLYRIGICQWESDTSKAARKNRQGAYSKFLAAIKTNVNFAPAYTSLGFYYQDYAKDRKRGRQCFQKAFELSPSEVVAAEQLAKYFADQRDWDIVEVVAQRVVDSGKTRPSPGSKSPGISWPYSALGVVQMNKQEYQNAIVSFLAALRIDPTDFQSYIGLGESYHNSGRYNSALRTFNHALEPGEGTAMSVVGETWFAQYMLANVYRELGEHDVAIARLQDVLQERPSELGVLMSLLQTFVERAQRCLETGVFGLAVQSAQEGIKAAIPVAKLNPDAFNLWKAVGDAASVISYVQSGDLSPLEDEINSLVNMAADSGPYSTLQDIDAIGLTSLSDGAADSQTKSGSIPWALTISMLAYKRALHVSANDLHAQAVAWYNLGWAEQRAHTCSNSKANTKHLRAAVRCFKRAIELEAGNAEFWNALGVVTTTLNPKVAQHAFVRSLHLNELNAKVWANLGVLYLLQDDVELAQQAFGRSQSTDPDYAHAWVGQGLLSLKKADALEALNHFTHAFEISDATSVIVKERFGVASFDHLLASSSAYADLTALIQPAFALAQLRTQIPSYLPFRHLSALLFERVGNHEAAVETLKELCTAAESEYEASESLTALAQFATANSDLSRNQLALHDFSGAAEAAALALDLSSDDENSGLSVEARRKLRLSAHLTAGIAQYRLSQAQDSISMFRSALIESSNDPDVVCLLVQVLWAQGGEDEKAVAREQLFECVEKYPDHAGAITLLGAIAALDDDEDTLGAVHADLSTLRTKEAVETHAQDNIERLLTALAALGVGGAFEKDVKAESQAAVFLKPAHSPSWGRLADLTQSPEAASMAVKTAVAMVPPKGDVNTTALAEAYAGAGTAADSQRSIFLSPWSAHGWESLKSTVCR